MVAPLEEKPPQRSGSGSRTQRNLSIAVETPEAADLFAATIPPNPFRRMPFR
jgi:hypothetical protein